MDRGLELFLLLNLKDDKLIEIRDDINSEIINIMHNENIAEPAVCKMLEDINEYQMLITEILKERRKKDDDK